MPVASPSFHATLLSTLERASASLDDSFTLLTPLLDSGVLDMDMPLRAPGGGTQGTRSFLALWLAQTIERHHHMLTIEDWKQFQRWSPGTEGLLDTKGPYRDSLFQIWMTCRSRSPITEVDQYVLDLAGPKAWRAWTDDSWHKIPTDARLMVHLMHRHRECGGLDLAPLLIERGLSWQTAWTSDNTGRDRPFYLAESITTQAQWESYLAHKGDPQLLVHQEDSAPIPLWRHLVHSHRSSPELKAIIPATLETFNPSIRQDIQFERVKKIFDRFALSFDHDKAIKEMMQVTGLDWTQLRDKQGRNVAQALLSQYNCAALFKAYTKSQKGQKLLLECDAEGRGAWAYLLSAEKVPADIQSILTTAKVPPALDKKGRGLLFQLVQINKEGQPEVGYNLTLTKQSADLLADPKLWLSAPPATEQAYLDYLIQDREYWSSMRGTVQADTLSRLAHLWTKDNQDLGPRWRAALCLNELFTTTPDWDWIGQQISQGVTMNWSADRPTRLMDQLGPVKDTNSAGKGISQDRHDKIVATMRLLQADALVPDTKEPHDSARRRRLRT